MPGTGRELAQRAETVVGIAVEGREEPRPEPRGQVVHEHLGRPVVADDLLVALVAPNGERVLRPAGERIRVRARLHRRVAEQALDAAAEADLGDRLAKVDVARDRLGVHRQALVHPGGLVVIQVGLEEMLVLVRERRLDQERAGGTASAEITRDRVMGRARSGAMEPVDTVDRDHVAVDLLVERRHEDAAHADPHVHVEERRVADVVDERDDAVAGGRVVVLRQARARGERGGSAVSRWRGTERLRHPRLDRPVELLREQLSLRVAELDSIVVAAVAGRKLEPLRDAVLVARDPDLDVRSDGAKGEVLDVQLVRGAVERGPETSVADDRDCRRGSSEAGLRSQLVRGRRSECQRLEILRARLGEDPPRLLERRGGRPGRRRSEAEEGHAAGHARTGCRPQKMCSTTHQARPSRFSRRSSSSPRAPATRP